MVRRKKGCRGLAHGALNVMARHSAHWHGIRGINAAQQTRYGLKEQAHDRRDRRPMTELAMMEGFSAPERAQWLALVEKALKGADFERRLVARTADDLRILPLYARSDAPAEVGEQRPGAAPFLRGSSAGGFNPPWDIRQVHAEPDPAAANAAILDDLAGGATSLKLQIGAPGWSGLAGDADTLAAALKGVLHDVCPVALEAGEETATAAASLMALWQAAGIADTARLGAFNADPLGTLALTGALRQPLEAAMAEAAVLAERALGAPHLTALVADGHPYHAAGASEAQELAVVLATLAAYLRALDAKGIAPAQALPKIAINLAVDADQILGLAKLRAARGLVWQVADACGAGDAVAQMTFGAESSLRMMAKRDPWVNMLRTTIACATAAMGGAQVVTVLPFTWAIGRPDAFARRMARNTHLVLQEESGLGRVVDPAGGSFAIETLTAEMAATAWRLFQEIEAAGGMAAALTSGRIQDDIANVAEARRKQLASGRLEMTGVSAFPRLGGDGVNVTPWPDAPVAAAGGVVRVKPLAIARLAEPFEALRDAADAYAARTRAPAQIFLACLGDLATYGARATWIANFLAAGGIASSQSEPLDKAEGAAISFVASGAQIACLCAADATYAGLGAATATALKSAGAQRVYLAGRPKDLEAALIAAGVDGFIFAGSDAVATLADLHKALGISSA
jgi:methylmalonyl-CoA mutase